MSLTSSIEDQLTFVKSVEKNFLLAYDSIFRWRGRMQVTVHSLPFQFFILSLVGLDALIVLFELLLDVGAFGEQKYDCCIIIICIIQLVLHALDWLYHALSPLLAA